MDSDSIAKIIGIVILVILSAFFSATETAFSSLNRIRVKTLAEGGSKRASLVFKLSQNYDKLLSTILVGNNIVNIAAASIGTLLFVSIFQKNGATISTIVITVVVLIFGEISPKSMAKESPEKFAMFAAPIIKALSIVLTPVNFIFSIWKKILSKIFKSSDDRSITEEELLTIVDEAEQDGAINEEDKELINSVIDFNDSHAQDILTPRVDIAAVSNEATMEEITQVFIETGYSRIPVYEESIDSIVGVIHLRGFFEAKLNKKEIKDIITPAVYVTPKIKISDLLKYLQSEKCHLAVVTDEFGGTAGIVTMEDILEELVGEIWDEHDEVIEDFVKIDDKKYRISCSAAIDEMLEFFEINKEVDSTTVSGWIIDELGKIPEEGDTFEYENLFVTVSKTDHRRVIEIIVDVKEIDIDIEKHN